MTRLRKLAVRISDNVVRHCPPAYKDWALGIARELEFIESDWAALRWALGSWRMAASCQNAPLTSLSEVPGAARSFLRQMRTSMVLTAASLLWMGYWFSGIFRHTLAGRQTSLGWAFLLAALVYVVCEAVAFRGWRLPRGGQLPEVAGAYRAALVHQRDHLNGVWFWYRGTLVVAGPLLGAYHAWLLKPGAVREGLLNANLAAGGIVVLALLVTRPVTRRVIARYQRTIDQLDALAGDGR